MSATVFWAVLAGVLLALELMQGTFYLLVLAGASVAAAVIAWAGGGWPAQLMTAAVLGLGGALVLRSTRFGRRVRAAGDAAPAALDVGQRLRVEHWSDNRTARAEYRGAQWQVELEEGADARPGEYEIRAIRGIRLVVAPVQAP